MTSSANPAVLASWTLFMLDWVSTFLQRCQPLRRHSISVALAVEVFQQHIHNMLPGGESVSQMLDHLSGADCAAQLHACQSSPAGRGEGLPFASIIVLLLATTSFFMTLQHAAGIATCKTLALLLCSCHCEAHAHMGVCSINRELSIEMNNWLGTCRLCCRFL